jgi:hypothetical protein
MIVSIQTTMSDISGLSYRLSNIEKQVSNIQNVDEEKSLFISVIIFLLLLSQNEWIIGLIG